MRFIIFVFFMLLIISSKAGAKSFNTSINDLLEQKYDIIKIQQSGENYYFILRKKGKYGYDDLSGDYIKSGEKILICKTTMQSTTCYYP